MVEYSRRLAPQGVSRCSMPAVLIYGLSLLLMTRYERPRLSIYYLSVGAVALRIIGQLAVLGPRGAPAVATRSA